MHEALSSFIASVQLMLPNKWDQRKLAPAGRALCHGGFAATPAISSRAWASLQDARCVAAVDLVGTLTTCAPARRKWCTSLA